GLLVGLLAHLLIGRLLLLLRRRLLRIRGLAASGHEGGPRNDCNDRQFQKCDTSSAPGLLPQITYHGRPFPGLRAPVAPLSTPTHVSGSICPETPAWSKISCARPPRLPAHPTRRRRRRFQGALPDRSVVELNGHAVRGIDRAEIGPGNPEAARVIHPASGRLADLVDQDIGSAGPRPRHPERLGTQPSSPVCACSLVSSLLLSGATMSQQSSLRNQLILSDKC